MLNHILAYMKVLIICEVIVVLLRIVKVNLLVESRDITFNGECLLSNVEVEEESLSLRR
jgi:hypothetical protein